MRSTTTVRPSEWRPRLAVWCGPWVALACAHVACGFPEVSFDVSEGGAPSSASSDSQSSHASSSSRSSAGGSSEGGGGLGGAGGGATVGSGGGGGVDPCDVDGDGIPSAKPGCEVEGDGGAPPVYDCDDDGDGFDADFSPCNGNDCDDSNAAVRPNQKMFFAVPYGDGSFDYDCSGIAEPQYPSGSCGCPPDTSCNACSNQGVFSGSVPCGAVGDFRSCTLGLFTCNPSGSVISAVRRCR